MFKKGCKSLNKGKHNGRPRKKIESYHSEYGKKVIIKCCICEKKMERYVSQLVNQGHKGGIEDKFYCLDCYRSMLKPTKLNRHWWHTCFYDDYTLAKEENKYRCLKCNRTYIQIDDLNLEEI